MDIKTLIYFLEIAKTGSITYAAHNLHITQPTLSLQMKALEKEVGHTLYTRVSKGIKLTQAGKILKDKAQEIVYLNESTMIELDKLKPNLPSELKISCVNNIIRKDLSMAINEFRTAHPDIKLCFYSGDMDHIRYDARNNESDIQIGYFGIDDPNAVTTNLRLDLGILMNLNNPLADVETIPLNSLYSMPLVAPKKSNVGPVLKRNGINYEDLDIKMEIDDPVNFYGVLSDIDIFVLCLKPSQNVLEQGLLCFKPFKPNIKGFVSLKYSERRDNPNIKLFLDHLYNYGIVNVPIIIQ